MLRCNPPASGLRPGRSGMKMLRTTLVPEACAENFQPQRPKQPLELAPCGLTPELSRAAKRHRLERNVRPQAVTLAAWLPKLYAKTGR
jgi:hypothetical protein